MFYVSPGVYARERDISEIVPNIATTVGAIVGYSAKGDITSPQLITTSQQFIEEYGAPTPGQYFHYSALAFLENGKQLYCLRVQAGALYGGVKIMTSTSLDENMALAVGLSAKTFAAVSGEDILFYVFGKDPGTWNNNLSIKVSNVDEVNYTFDIEVFQTDTDGNVNQVESFTVSRKTQVDGYGRQQYLEDAINGISKYIVVADNTSEADTVLPKAQATTLLLAGGYNGSAVGDSEVNTGWDTFANPDDIDVRILINGGYASIAVHAKMKTIAEARKDCIAILDMPYDHLTSVTAMVEWRRETQNINSSYCALYSPWVKVYDQYNDKTVTIPPSGYVASQLAYNDYVAEAWYAPAGFNRGLLNVLGVSDVFTQGERDTLYPAQINPIQMFRGEGTVIWGQKTLQTKASALDRVNVRRLLIVMQKAMSVSLRGFAFEPNNELTRFRVVSMMTEYLEKLGARGAFQADTGDRGFRVVCDTTNNTPAVIDSNELRVDVFIKPTRAAEFIQLQTIITRTGVSFDELIARGVMF